ncbi:hypothetical protein CDAR_311591 [Caerostris darwini]|uniref:Uncharacterized protein n=1 Tax=Caerostris darwini TaxID=1538125 RepID=A0AAV4USS1_9ARAC|nr:hypothetical protein CDAR_311591 [Caerostris darwini]
MSPSKTRSCRSLIPLECLASMVFGKGHFRERIFAKVVPQTRFCDPWDTVNLSRGGISDRISSREEDPVALGETDNYLLRCLLVTAQRGNISPEEVASQENSVTTLSRLRFWGW